ncbi:hypothetical protein B5M09_013852 [Aphanomyces astaci]|uniref:DDE-1 domain-containing protein n=1 Tax=Aphanomyces astaci TaxID=112090 RepID=A0A3R7YKR3_APHAT|nr:hypothetical protein B5M09_013852 [Aphanomyces astaci]
MPPTEGKLQQRRYTNSDRKTVIAQFHASGCANERQFCRGVGIPYGTWQGWRRKESQITSSTRHGRKATMGGQGRKSMIPFMGDIIAYMSEWRDNNKFIRVFHLMQWIRRNQKPWLVSYIEAKKSPEDDYETLRCLLLRFCTRNRFRHRKPCVSKLSQEVLDSVWLDYAAYFHTKYAAYPKHTILNADETGLCYGMPPGSTLAEIGKSSKVDKSEKHSERLTALLTIRADGKAIKQLLLKPM